MEYTVGMIFLGIFGVAALLIFGALAYLIISLIK